MLTRSSANGLLENLRFDAAALLYVPDRVSTIGGVADDQLDRVFGADPFVSHLYEMPLGRIGVITLPIRGKELMGSPRVAGLVRKAGQLARRRGAKCVSLTGLIPSATDYGRAVHDWFGDAGPRVTTGHATTTAAVIRNLESMLDQTGRHPAWEHLAILGLGSIGQSCLALLLDVLPHPRALTLCDVFAKQEEVAALAHGLRDRYGYRGPVRVVASDRGLPDALYEATTILTAVSVPDVIDVDRLRPGTIIVDDSYPPGFPLERAIRRAETDGDLVFGNAGMVRLADSIRGNCLPTPRRRKSGRPVWVGSLCARTRPRPAGTDRVHPVGAADGPARGVPGNGRTGRPARPPQPLPRPDPPGHHRRPPAMWRLLHAGERRPALPGPVHRPEQGRAMWSADSHSITMG